MDNIAQLLNISKATLYKYFSSKKEIINEVVRYKIGEIVAFEAQLADTEITFSEQFFDVVKEASMILSEISEQFLYDTKRHQPKLFEKVIHFQDRALTIAERFYQRGIEAGVIKNIDPKILALTDKMFIRSVSNPKFLSEHNITRQQAFDAYFLMKSKGIFKS